MSVTDELLAANAEYAATFDGPLPLPPARRVAVVACMDARLDVHRVLGLAEGDAHVIRNAGGAVTDDVIRSLAISQRLLGTREIVLIHHTDCGMLTFRDDAFRTEIEREVGVRPPWAGGRPPVDRAAAGEPVRAADRRRARLRLRRGHRAARRGGGLSPP